MDPGRKGRILRLVQLWYEKTMKVPERFTWALEVLDCKPTDTLLEIGCGSGMLAGQIAMLLEQGTITAIDLSEKMIVRATKCNQNLVSAQKAQFKVGSLLTVPLPNSSFDKVLAFNVSVFWKSSPKNEFDIIRQVLKPSGFFYLFHQPPTEITIEVAERARFILQMNGFEIIETAFKPFTPASASCIIAKPSEKI